MFYLKNPTAFFPLPLLLIILAFLFFFSCTHLNKPSDDSLKVQNKKNQDLFPSFNPGLGFIKKGKLSEARNQLEKLSYGEEGFLLALLEIQKINYIEQDWDRFFVSLLITERDFFTHRKCL